MKVRARRPMWTLGSVRLSVAAPQLCVESDSPPRRHLVLLSKVYFANTLVKLWRRWPLCICTANGLQLCPAQNHLCPHIGLLNSAWTLKKMSTLMSFISGVLLFSRGVPCWMKIRDTNWKMIIHISKELASLQYGRTLKTLFAKVKQTRHKWINITWFHYVRYLEESSSSRQKVEEGMAGSGWGSGGAGAGVWEWGVPVEREQSFSLGRCKSSGGGWKW